MVLNVGKVDVCPRLKQKSIFLKRIIEVIFIGCKLNTVGKIDVKTDNLSNGSFSSNIKKASTKRDSSDVLQEVHDFIGDIKRQV